MGFEWDPAKSDKVKAERGIDFAFARRAWDDAEGVEFPARSETEPRFARVARIDGLLYVVLFTTRGDNIRIITVRRARPNEEKLYG